MSELDELRAAIEALEAQRTVLGDAAVAAAVVGLRQRLAALEQAAQPAPEGERKQTTVMFADLSGFTALAETADAEDIRNLVNACFERVGEVVKRYGGYIDKFIGDELMVLFGAPVAMEDHAPRALYAALEVRESFAAFNEEHPQLREYPLSLHFGINSGLVVAGAIGTEAKRDYTVMGDSVNVAARLVAQAQPGEILVGASTHRLVGERFELEDMGLTQFKGRAQPQQVYRLRHALAGAQAAGGVGSLSRMIGREAELRTIQEEFRNVVALRQPRSVAVVGPAGIGKSRLQREFRAWLEKAHPDVVILHGAALPHVTATPYFMIGEFLRNWLSVKEMDSAVDIRRRLETALAELGIGDQDVPHALAAIMALEYEDDRLQSLTPEERKDRIFSAFTTLIGLIASRGPVLLQFEDLHWIDDLSMDLLEHLFGELAGSPVLVLTLTRPILDASAKPRRVEARTPKETHTRILLSELDETASSELVTSLAAGLDQTPEIVQAIVRKGQGNPFFVEEIIATLIDQGALVRDAHGVRATGDLSELSVPDTVWGVLAERIDRLPPDEKRVIHGAAISGQLFWEGLVRELARLDPSAPLAALNQREFVDRLGPAAFADDWEWSFRHILVQEVAYSGLLRETRRAGHLAAADWLERRAGDRRNEYSTVLAHHYQLGENWTKTVEFAELAGDRAAGLSAHQEARFSFLQALGALGQLDVDQETRRHQIDVTLKLARVSYYTSTDEVWQALEAAKAFAEEIEDEERRLRVITAMASWLYMAGRTRPAVEMALQSVAEATDAGLEELLVVPYTILSRLMYAMGEYQQCAEMIEKSNGLAETYGVEWRDSSNLGFLGMTYQLLGQLEKGQALCLDGLRVAEQKRDLRLIGSAHLYLGVPACLIGLLEEAEVHLQQAMTIGEETGDLSMVYMARGFLGYWHTQRDELEPAADCLDGAIALAAELDSFLFVSLLEAYRAEVEIKAGHPAEAVTRAERAVELAKETRQQGCEAEAHRVLGWARHYTQPEAREPAEQELRTALELHRKTGGRVFITRTLYELAAYLRLVGDEAGAAQAEAEASATARERGLDWLPTPPPTPIAMAVSGRRSER